MENGIVIADNPFIYKVVAVENEQIRIATATICEEASWQNIVTHIVICGHLTVCKVILLQYNPLLLRRS